MIRRTVAISALAALLGAGLLAASTAAGQPAPGRSDTLDRRWATEGRTLDFTYDADGFQYQSRRASTLGEDLIQVGFDLASATYTHEFISTEPRNETVITTRIVLDALIEFRDRDRDGRYGVGDDTVRRTPLAAHPGASLTSESSLASGARTTTVVFPIDSSGDGLPPLGGGSGLDGSALSVSFVVAPRGTVFDSVAVGPTSERIGIRITDYPYDANSTGTRLALTARIATTGEQAASPNELAGQDGYFDVAIGWDDQATVDGSRIAVGASALSDVTGVDDGTLVAIAYPRAKTVVHGIDVDAVRYEARALGEIVEALARGDWRLYMVGTLFSAAVVGVPAALRLRRGG